MTRTTQRPRYELRNGQYCLFDLAEAPAAATGQRPCHLRTDLVALAYDPLTGAVHQHGDPRVVQAWAFSRRRQLRADGLMHQANRVWVVSGPLPVDDINRCLDTPGYLLRLMRRLPQVPHGKLGVQPRAPAGTARTASAPGAAASTAARAAAQATARAAERERQRARMRDLQAQQERARAEARERARQTVRDDLKAQAAAWSAQARSASAGASASASANTSDRAPARPRTGCYGFAFPSCPGFA